VRVLTARLKEAFVLKQSTVVSRTHAERDRGYDDLDLIGRPVPLHSSPFIGLHTGMVVVDAQVMSL